MACSGTFRILLHKNSTFVLRNTLLVESRLKGTRTFLSKAYRCQEAWDKRLEHPVIKKIQLDDMYHEVDQKFQQDGIISAVDVDLFAAAVQGDSHLDELEDLVHRLRLSASAANTLPATPHSLIRAFLAAGHTDALLRVLNDRLNYGVFPDHYAANLLIDTFLEKQQYLEAAHVGVLQMLQEDWAHPLTTRLSLLGCMYHLRFPTPWDNVGQSIATPEEESKEEVKVRVNFLRNPFFDDHFDLKEGRALVGKTLALLSPHLPPGPLARSLELLGLALYGKWNEAEKRLQQWTLQSSEPVLIKQAVEMASEALQATEVGSTEVQGAAELLQSCLSSVKTSEGDLLAPLEDAVREAAAQHEASDIELQTRIYADWEKAREHELAKQLAELDRVERLSKVEEKKRYLQEKEERLYFFDREQEWELKIEEMQPRYRKRWFGKLKKKRVVDEGYVPPEVGRGAN